MRKLLAFLLFGCIVSSAQVTTGTILGTVRDNTQAAVDGASVTITETGKGTSIQLKTDQTGAFQAPLLISGTYSVSVAKDGFKKAVQAGVTLEVDQKARVDMVLELGAVTETVNVTAATPLVQIDSSEMGEVIAERAIRELPLNGRNFAQLVYLTPGITPGTSNEALSGASALNPRGSSNYNPLGQQSIANGWLVDGIDNNEFTFNTVIVTPSIESVREFKVLTGAFSAEFGRGAGVVSVSTKSGDNELHGNVFEFLRNSALDARNYFTPATSATPPFRRSQFGAAAGGPVVIPKLYNGHGRTFFFMDYAGWREVRGTPYVNTVPDARTRVGDFSNYTNNSGALIRIYNPTTTRLNPAFDPSRAVSSANPQFLRDLFPGNIIPIVNINPVGLNIASIYPLPNGPGNSNNYTAVVNRNVNDDVGSVRLDHQLGTRNSLFFRFTYDAYSLIAPQAAAACCLPTPASAAAKFDLGPYVAGTQVTTLATQGAAFNDSHAIRPNLLNEFRTGYSRTNPYTIQSDYGHNAAQSLGIQGINISPFSTGIPNLNVQNFTGLSGGPNFIPVNNKQTNIQFDDSIFWTRGRHSLKFGYHYVRRLLQPFVNIDTRGTFAFNSNFTNDPVTNTQGTGLATLLTGYINSGNRGYLKEPYYITTQEHAAFVQDDMKVSRRLTLNLGLRWDAFVPEQEIRDRIVNFDRVALKMAYAGEGGVSRRANKQTRMHNFGPRVGFAWDFLGDGKTVIRSGFGISYFPLPVTANGQLGLQVPYVISQNFASETNPTNFALVPSINNPLPAIVTVKPLTTADLNAAAPQVIGQSYANETPYAETWTLSIQRQLTSSLVWEVAYGGSRGIHLTQSSNINEVQPGTTSQAARRLIPQLSNVVSISEYDPKNMSVFHSLQTKVEKRYAHGLQFLFGYTYGKALDFGGPSASGGGATGNPQTVTNLRAGRGASSFDVKHRAVASYLWDIPSGGVTGLRGRVLGGWQLGGIITATTGRPFNVTLNTGVNNGAPSWPNRIGPGTLENPDPARWFNPGDFVAPPSNTYGNVARGVLYAPGVLNMDMSLVKSTQIHERWKVQLRFEAFNLTNTPYFGYPNASIGSPTVGQITTTVGDNRSLQVALKVVF